jgi:hypothetical protein
MTKPNPHKFFCWMKVVKRPAVTVMIPSVPPPKKSAKNTSDYDEEWIGIEPYYNEPTNSAYVLDYWSGEAFDDKIDAEKWFQSSAGKIWLDGDASGAGKAIYYTLMAFDVKAK